MLLIRKPHLEKNIQNFLSPSSLIPNGHYSGSIAFLALHQQIQANEKDFRRGPTIPAMSLIFSSKNLPFSPASNFRCPFLLSCSGKIANRSPVSSCNIVHFFCAKTFFHILLSTIHFKLSWSLQNSDDPFLCFWSISHPRCDCSLFLSHDAWGSDSSFLQLLLCIKASSNAWSLCMKKHG